jgi:hypothetical protein
MLDDRDFDDDDVDDADVDSVDDDDDEAVDDVSCDHRMLSTMTVHLFCALPDHVQWMGCVVSQASRCPRLQAMCCQNPSCRTEM